MIQNRSCNVHRLLAAATVVVAISMPAALEADSVSSVVVFGDSLSDNGNLYAATGQPAAPYFDGRRSNGPVAVEQLANSLGVPLFDYAWIGATSGIGNYADQGTTTSLGTHKLPGMLSVFDTSKAPVQAHLSGLFVVWGGANDFLAPSPLDTTPQQIIVRGVGDILTIVDGLKSLGATNILVPGIPDLGLTPYFRSLGPTEAAEASALSDAFNAALVAELPAGVKYFDTAQLVDKLVADPAAYGFTDVQDACFNGTTVCHNPNQYLFFDSFHPTSQADAFAAQGFLSTVVPEPGALALLGFAVLGLVACRASILERARATLRRRF